MMTKFGKAILIITFSIFIFYLTSYKRCILTGFDHKYWNKYNTFQNEFSLSSSNIEVNIDFNSKLANKNYPKGFKNLLGVYKFDKNGELEWYHYDYTNSKLRKFISKYGSTSENWSVDDSIMTLDGINYKIINFSKDSILLYLNNIKQDTFLLKPVNEKELKKFTIGAEVNDNY